MYNMELSFKCRRCRFYLFDGDSILSTGGAANHAANQGITVWYINEENYPEWIHNSINKAQWTKGKLNCPKCIGRLGSFDFITPNKIQMSNEVFSPVQIVKNRVDCQTIGQVWDQIKQSSPVQKANNIQEYRDGGGYQVEPNTSVQPPCAFLTTYAEATAAIEDTSRNDDDNNAKGQDSPHFDRALGFHGAKVKTQEQNPGSNRVEQSTSGQNESKTMTNLPKQAMSMSDSSVGDRMSAIANNDSLDSCTSKLTCNKSRQKDTTCTNEGLTTQEVDDTIDVLPTSQRTNLDIVDNSNTIPSGATPESNPDRTDLVDSLETLPRPGDIINDMADRIQFMGTSFDGENSASWEEFFEEIMEEIQDVRASTQRHQENESDVEEGDDEEISDLTPRQLSKRHRSELRKARNRRKKINRKRRKQEKWRELQGGCERMFDTDDMEPDLSSLVDILGTDWSHQALQEVTTCSVCLDVFYQPHSCVPCDHIFCEPCLRQLAQTYSVVAPCPLCRTNIQTVVAHHELTTAIKKLFPAQVQRRKEAERRTIHRSFPLPGHSTQTPITRPWFRLPRYSTTGENDRIRRFTNRVNRVRQRREELNRTALGELAGETITSLLCFALVVGVIISFMSLMNEFA